MSTQVVPPVPSPPPPGRTHPTNKEEALQDWLDRRSLFIGGSEAHELLNEPQYGKGCVRAMAYRKVKAEPDYPQQLPDEALLERGKILEPIVASVYEEATGRKVRRPAMDEWGFPRVQVNSDYPGAGVHTDRLILVGSGDVTAERGTGDLEIKTHGEGPYLHIMRDGLPPAHNLQPQWSNFVTGHSWNSFAILGVFGGLPMKHFDNQRDNDVMEIFKRETDRFWGTLEQGKLPSPPFPADDQRCKVCAYRMTCRGEELDKAEAAFIAAEKNGKIPLVQIANAKLSQALADRQLLKAELRTITNPEPTKEFPDPGVLDLVEETIKQELGVVDAALVAGFGKVYHKEQAGRTSGDLGGIVQYLEDVAGPAEKVVSELEVLIEKVGMDDAINHFDKLMLGQVVTLLKNVSDVPKTVTTKYMRAGRPFRSLRVYPSLK